MVDGIERVPTKDINKKKKKIFLRFGDRKLIYFYLWMELMITFVKKK